ncbi:MAG: hypothetical protein COA54_12965 [Thiotrichaceae bacterium]|nr:MAG: hypothetical protein COA54_12965 [Thiotrichaceae bacterium]
MEQWKRIAQHIEAVTGHVFSMERAENLPGGSINAAFMLVDTSGRHYFVKTNQADREDMFAAETEGLEELAESHTIRVPKPVCFGSNPSQSYIVMEYLPLKECSNQSLLGEQLASMHTVTADCFGWRMNNTIGATHQPNAWHSDWIEFWRTQRLGYQLELAAKSGYGGQLQVLGDKLLLNMHKLFEGRTIQPAMLHGDLWGGNVAGLADGTPVIFDPAFYYGDREADLAMTYVFGGFTADFYAAYQNVLPLDDGFEVRKVFYNLYHIINHLNLFGGGYRGQAVDMMERVLVEI